MIVTDGTPPQVILGLDPIPHAGPDFIYTRHLLVERFNWMHAQLMVKGEDDPECEYTSGPISLLKIGRWYHVSDGHHRLARAIYHQSNSLDAYVVREAQAYEQLSELVRGVLDDWAWVSIGSTNNLVINVLQGEQQ